MRCLAPNDIASLFGDAGFTARAAAGAFGRPQVCLDRAIAEKQRRLGARPPLDVGQLMYFAGALNRWLPTDRSRLLWIAHWSITQVETDDDFLMAARRGLGERRSLVAAPGHYFEPQPYAEQDQFAATRELRANLALLVGLTSMVMISGSDGYLLAGACSDRIEFWEGNLFFYSSRRERLSEAEALLKVFDCPRDLA